MSGSKTVSHGKEMMGLFHDRIHKDSGKGKAAETVRTTAEEGEEEEEENLGPKWTCTECGSLDHRDVVYPSTPLCAEEYDMECKECGSTDIAESPLEAVNSLVDKLTECRERIAELTATNDNVVKETRNTEQDYVALEKEARDLMSKWRDNAEDRAFTAERSSSDDGHARVSGTMKYTDSEKGTPMSVTLLMEMAETRQPLIVLNPNAKVPSSAQTPIWLYAYFSLNAKLQEKQ